MEDHSIQDPSPQLLEVAGLTDLFAESWCLIEYRMRGRLSSGRLAAEKARIAHDGAIVEPHVARRLMMRCVQREDSIFRAPLPAQVPASRAVAVSTRQHGAYRCPFSEGRPPRRPRPS